MRRREFIAGLGGAAAWPVVARAQQSGQMRRIGVLMTLSQNDPEGQARIGALRDGLKQLGWIDGRNVRIDYRWAGGDVDRLPIQAAELAALKPDVVFAAPTSALVAMQKVTRTIPIVFAQVSDPLGAGHVASLARPGGNITGFTQFEFVIGVKWLELLKQIAPGVARVAIVHNPNNPISAEYLSAMRPGEASLGVQLSPAPVRNADEIERAIVGIAREPNGGLIALPNTVISANREQVIALAARHRLPAVYPLRYFAINGGLVSYGVDNHDLYRRAASYVDRILKGEKPGDLPVQKADKFELVINLKTAKALGLDVPMSLLARTDEVIE